MDSIGGCASAADDQSSAPFVLTVDSLVRLLAIKTRLMSDVPVVFMGETGCGKTHLVHFFCRICGYRLETINVHGGMQPADLLQYMLQIITAADGANTIVLLDEVNSMPQG
jgi:midasin (ATPase involved in ribosome maturation)